MLSLKALPEVPRWVVLTAHAVPLVCLPSALWRLAFAAGLPVTRLQLTDAAQVLYVLLLAVVSEGLALLTLGLVQRWGEVFPRWMPLLGGRRVPPLPATAAALLGAAALAVLLARVFHSNLTEVGQDGIGTPAQFALMLVCYIPMLAWPPLLAVVAVAYHRRRVGPRAGTGPRRTDGPPPGTPTASADSPSGPADSPGPSGS
ncbi:hypothetical protein MTQ01_06510 [Streptomyces sp. XM4193]|uniref:hypothetical protein n=1 Tax=Streptomyces sp. XM4193 TaxID=2929782 RepID=UPI001FF95762|nr:hypothetical protein [Streptomyces sp. XM4193]MCK1795665.1 hypothetical protein [Streptomyces sp. XM4193]